MAFRQRSIFLWIVFIFVASCSSTKSLPEGEKLYTGAAVKMKGSELPARQRKVLKTDLQGLTRPKPNSKVLGLPIKLYIYNSFAKKKPKSFWGKLRTKYGQPPVLLSSVDLEQNVKILQNHLENKGFFRAQVTGDSIVKKKKGSVTYHVAAGNQYTINNLLFPSDSSALGAAIAATTKESLLKKGEPYDLDLIKGERTRIDAAIKEKGYYYFGPDYLLMQVDSISNNNTVDMRLILKPETPDEATHAYRINNTYIYSGYNLTSANLDTSKASAKVYEGYTVIDRRNRFKPKMFAQIMRFSPGDLYNRTDHNLTLSRLINLNEFRYVKNRFEAVPDSAKLDVYYYLTPLPKQALRAEITATNKNSGFNGSQLTLSYRNRNKFRGGEQLSMSAYLGSEIGVGSNYRGYNTYRSGGEIAFSIPRFVIPFFSVNTKGGYVPRTAIQLGYDVINRRKLYTLNSYHAGLGYIWRESLTKQHEFFPISINYTQPLNITKQFTDSIGRYPYLRHVVDSQFIIGSTYQYNYNQLAGATQHINSIYFNGLVDLSGNIAGLISGSNKSNGKEEARILGARFNQYIKLEADARFYRRIGTKSTWANRVLVGYGNPYGNSRELPYITQYFAGGTNSVRAFRARTLGPGTFRETEIDSTKKGFYPDQTGDIRLEFNTEFRPHLYGPIYGAVFIDAGNIWLKNSDTARVGAKFSKDFIKELAVGAGVGLRVDITLFVIRLDVAMPLRKPWDVPPSQLRNLDKDYRKENVVFNLAIGYPF
ncbi:MAG TPA: BamA/TamA family outer membrane protein [Niastella sp.]|nr:BamA/TamA family outer membrane protein [Niastella sp.]